MGYAAPVEVPVLKRVPLNTRPIEAWSAREVTEWVSTVGGGTFTHIVLPKSLDGQVGGWVRTAGAIHHTRHTASVINTVMAQWRRRDGTVTP